MSDSYSVSETSTFTVTHARHMAAKVATDLKRMQRLYDQPSDTAIAQYEAEIVELLRYGYLGVATYGFRRDDHWIEPMLRYTARDLAAGEVRDEDPGHIRPGADVSGAHFYSYLSYSKAWTALTTAQQEAFLSHLPIRRNGAPEPGVDGYLTPDRMYSSGGRALERVSLRSRR